MKIRLLIAIAAIAGLSVVDAGAQFNSDMPPGSYRRSCDDVSMVGSVLTAHCKDQNGVMIHTRLYVRDCAGEVTNEFGELLCGERRMPRGTFSESCSECRSDGSAIRCTCQDERHKPIHTSLDLASCGWGSRITNKDGHLQCD